MQDYIIATCQVVGKLSVLQRQVIILDITGLWYHNFSSFCKTASDICRYHTCKDLSNHTKQCKTVLMQLAQFLENCVCQDTAGLWYHSFSSFWKTMSLTYVDTILTENQVIISKTADLTESQLIQFLETVFLIRKSYATGSYVVLS